MKISFQSLLFFAWIFLNCATSLHHPTGLARLEGKNLTGPAWPDSLRAELQVTSIEGDKKNSTAAVLSAIPLQRYKMDFYPFPGYLGGSFFWDHSDWHLAIYDKGIFVGDKGDSIFFPSMQKNGQRGLPLTFILGALWEGYWPMEKDSVLAEGANTWRIENAKEIRHMQINANGLIQTIWDKDKILELQFSDYFIMQNRMIPKHWVVKAEGKIFLEIKVDKLEFNPHWHKSPFFILPAK